MTASVIDSAFLDLLRKDRILPSEHPGFRLLTGGVSSELYRIDGGGKTIVVKRALKKLKVKADWFAEVSRNRYEAAFLRYVGGFLPNSVPLVLHEGEGYFVMEFLDGYRDWKSLLKEKTCKQDHAQQAGALLGKIHIHSFGDPTIAKQFDAIANFVQLRISPYLYHIANRHPAVAEIVHEEAERLIQTKKCLIHGDFSPKNILISSDRLVLVDCEVAFYGDPAFDVGFLLCHLLLKALLHAPDLIGFLGLTNAFMAAYQNQLSLNNVVFTDVERRTAHLLPMLLLARVDGKSPVEYLNSEQQAFTREFALTQIKGGDLALKSLIGEWWVSLKKF